jgi:hypothetical protein
MGQVLIRRKPGVPVFKQAFMTSQAVFLDDMFPFLLDENNLGFVAQGKDSGMPQTVLCLEIVFVEYIIMRHMAIIAIGNFPVCTVVPGGVLRSHYMAIHACLRPVRQVRMSF